MNQILVLIFALSSLPMMAHFAASFFSEEYSYSIMNRRKRIIIGVISIIAYTGLIFVSAYSVRIGCKNCIEYELVNEQLYKRKS